MINLNVDIRHVLDFVSEEEIYGFENEITGHRKSLFEGTGKGSDFLGWINLPEKVDRSLIKKITEDAEKIRDKAEIFVVTGIGGSYLGARAVIESLSHQFQHLKKNRKNPLIVYAGHQLSEDYLSDLLEVLDEKDYGIAVISKSGTTTEPAVAFRILRNHIEKKYGREEASRRIIAITDESKGALRKLADAEGYSSYVVPDDVGGRYSVLTPVGLVPIAVAGLDIEELLQGAGIMESYYRQAHPLPENPVELYAATRNALYRKGKQIEIMVNYLPQLFYFTEWWKQLYGESEGKENKGIFPAGVNFTTDLHSMGQYIQQGLRNIFETILSVDQAGKKLEIPKDQENLDGLNYLSGRRIHEVNKMAELGTLLAHVDGQVPNIKISVPKLNENILGQLIWFFEMGCAVSGYILGVNPFDQPGVEDYKRNMFALLGKPGFEEETKRIRQANSFKYR